MALGFVRSAAILITPFWQLSNGMRRGRAEAQYGNREEDGANHADKNELRPDHVDTGAAVKDRLRERHEMCRRRGLHEGCQPMRHAFKRRIAAGKQIHRQKYQHEQQTELRHGARHYPRICRWRW